MAEKNEQARRAFSDFEKKVGPAAAQDVLNKIADAVLHSWETHPMKTVTEDERKRRVSICIRILTQLINDHGWSTIRALDHVGSYLRCELDGIPWEPSSRKVWMP